LYPPNSVEVKSPGGVWSTAGGDWLALEPAVGVGIVIATEPPTAASGIAECPAAPLVCTPEP
jgi:hypothetical protein